MRTERLIAAGSLVLVLSACAKRQEPTAKLPDDLKRDLAAAAASKDLTPVPQTFKRMRFVSEIEQTPGTTRAPRAQSAMHSDASAEVARNPVAVMAAYTPQATASEVSAVQPGVMVAAGPAPDIGSVPMPMPTETIEDHGRGIGGLLGGITSSVVIRGGRVGDGKCDPRSEAAARGMLGGRPNASMPQPTGQVAFPGARYY